MNAAPLREIPNETPQDVIELLERTLERAKTERVDSLAIILVGRDDLEYPVAGQVGNWLLAGTARLQHELILELREQALEME